MEYKASQLVKLRNTSAEDTDLLLPTGLVLLGYRGSIAHGMYLDPDKPESFDDRDLMGVSIPPIENYFGLKYFEQKEVQLNEWDSVTYELKKYIRLLLKSNPNVLSLLWLKDQFYIYRDSIGASLIENRDWFISKRIYKSYTGYAYSQLKRMVHGERYGYMGEKRKSLVQKYGYDCANAAHCIRLLRMGTECLSTGELFVYRDDAPQLVEIKTGKWTLEQVKAEAEHQFKRAEDAFDHCKLPNEPNAKKAEQWLVEVLSGHFY
jgi:hypothetical protein